MKVRITAGKAAGTEGIVHSKWTSHFGRGGPQLWMVRSDDLVRQRVMREDFLEVLP